MNKNILIVLIAIVLGISGWFFLGTETANGPDKSSTEEGTEVTNEVPIDGVENVDEMIVSGDGLTVTYIDDGGFSPASLEVSVGATVTFQNNGSKGIWPASALHPTHKLYPGSDISKCGTDDADSIFDACKSVAPGDSYSFTFDEVGTWGYHDHFRPSDNGNIIVLESE